MFIEDAWSGKCYNVAKFARVCIISLTVNHKKIVCFRDRVWRHESADTAIQSPSRTGT